MSMMEERHHPAPLAQGQQLHPDGRKKTFTRI